MLLLGLVIGILFVPFVRFIFDLPPDKVYTVRFFIITITSGLIVGSTSFLIVKITILSKLKDFSSNIETISKNIFDYQLGKISSINECVNCYVRLISNDIIGELAAKYNTLIRIIRSEFGQHEILEDYSKLISKTLQIDKLNNETAKFLCTNLGLLGVQIYNIPKGGELKLLTAKGIHTNLTDNMKNSLLDILETEDVREIKGDQIVEYGTGKIAPKHICFFPLKHLNNQWIFAIYSPYTMTTERKTLIKRLLNEYKFAYESAEMYEKVQNMAAIDELTGIYNRRFGMKRFQEEYKRALRLEKCMCVIMFDIDHFKKVNDTYGHQAGDYILATFGKILSNSFRTEDVVMRYGGEEFLCILCNSHIEDGQKRAEEVRAKTEKYPFNYKGTKIPITVSAGVSSFDVTKEKKTPEQLIKEADEALYIAKNTGRNRVVVYNASL